jgi:carboxylate-amine ligase
LTAEDIRAVFDAPRPLTVGLEEEVMLVDATSLDLSGTAVAVLGDVEDPRLKLELPASQLEVISAPASRVGDAIAELAAGRARLAELAAPAARVIAAGVHPFAAPLGELNAGERYDAILDDYGDVARSQLVCALQVHVAVGTADATLAVYNALRAHLPELAALAANAPFHAGRDTGFASIRPLIGGLLPRQGVPPEIPSWAVFAEMLAWGRASGLAEEPRRWWWELRPHVAYGTLEVRVPDAQTTIAESAAVAAYVHSLVAWLAERHNSGEALESAESWRIAENRWIAARRGLDGRLADLATGERRPVREILAERLETLAPTAARIGCAEELAGARDLIERNGAIRQREVAAERGLPGLTGWLAGRFLSS